jgi:hypothetical protein
MSRERCVFVLLALSLFAPLNAHAGKACEDEKPPSVEVIRQAMNLAEKTMSELNKSGAKVVLLARAGQDLTKYDLSYSHLGFAYRTSHLEGSPVWRVLHKLNECGTDFSAIYLQGLGDFFLDDLWRVEAAFVVPTPDVQERLLQALQDHSRALSLHHPAYSLVSYVWGSKYQQSNQWAIETLASVMEPEVTSRGRAQAWLQFKGYQPSVLRIGALTRLGGRMTRANVAFDDHPNEKRFSDRIETVTVDSVFGWISRTGLGTHPVQVKP